MSDRLRPIPLGDKPARIISPESQEEVPVRQAVPASPSSVPPRQNEKPQADRPYYETQTQRRSELASILWGEPDNSLMDVLSTPIPLPPHKLPPAKPQVQQAPKEIIKPQGEKPLPNRRAWHRRQCSFPGLLRVLIPEQSFQPRTFAVRIVDLSPMGAQVETKQMSADLEQILNKDQWYARLEALVPSREKILLSGRIVWARYKPQLSFLGLQFSRVYEEVDDFFVKEINAETSPKDLTLPSPIIDAFPTVTSTQNFPFTGRAPKSKEILVRCRSLEMRAPVIDGKFRVEVPLAADHSNFVSFTAIRGGISSIPTPICILHKAGASDTISIKPANLVEEFEVDPNGKRLMMKLTGPPQRFFQVLKKVSESLEHAQEVSLTLELHGDAEKAAIKLESLRPIK